VRTLGRHGFETAHLAFAPDGTALAAARKDGTIVIWNVATGEQVRALVSPTHEMNDLIFSPDGTRCLLDSKEGIEALSFYVSLCDAGLVESQRELDLAFQRGRIGFAISGDWLLDQLRRNPDAPDYGVALLPRPEGGQSISFAGGEYLVVPKKSTHAQEAQLFISFLLRPENNLKLCRAIGFMPSSRAAASNPYFKSIEPLQVFAAQLETARPTPVHPNWVEIEEKIEHAVEQAMYKALPPDSSLHRARADIDALLEE